jgi:hypothetical protein
MLTNPLIGQDFPIRSPLTSFPYLLSAVRQQCIQQALGPHCSSATISHALRAASRRRRSACSQRSGSGRSTRISRGTRSKRRKRSARVAEGRSTAQEEGEEGGDKEGCSDGGSGQEEEGEGTLRWEADATGRCRIARSRFPASFPDPLLQIKLWPSNLASGILFLLWVCVTMFSYMLASLLSWLNQTIVFL